MGKNNLQTHRILIVDDNPENLQVLANILRRENFHVEYAIDGKSALEWIREQAFDLIFLDVLMPEMDGFEVCKRIRSEEKLKDIPIIFITARTDRKSVLKGFELGAQDYVTKPFNSKELLARVNTQITLKDSREAIARYAEELEKKNKEIAASIRYARLIQNAVLPNEKDFLEILDDYFVFYRPKDIVSGDFYWVRKVENRIIIVGADCTGHGIPGAFMSMFGVAFLNEFIGKENITTPSRILNRLRETIIQALGQDLESEIKDGMDMAVLSIDHKNNMLEFAGARNPMYLIRDKQLIQFEYDRMSVSIGIRKDDFSDHTMEIKKNDQIYIFTDGFADQFGGPNDAKFKYQAFKQLLLKASVKPMKEQKKIITRAFDDWKREKDQTDDVLVFGIKI